MQVRVGVAAAWAMVALAAGCSKMATQPAPATATTQPADPTLTIKPSPSGETAIEARVDGEVITVAGTRTDSAQLKAAVGQARGSATLLAIELGAGYADAALAELLAAAAQAGFSRVRLAVGAEVMAFAITPGLSQAGLVAWVQEDRLTAYDLGATESKNGMLGPFQLGDPGGEAALHDHLAAACQHGACSAELDLFAASGQLGLVPTLGAWQRAVASIPSFSFQVLVIKAGPSARDPNAKAAQGKTEISGRLPPRVIQQVVRSNFEVFRFCYEAGLGRDPKLEGRVTLRFVIGRDGKVSDAKDGGSDLPDADVVSCVVRAMQKLQFPPPAGGIVTVVYPIVFAPG